MKIKLSILLLLMGGSIVAFAQQELRIHQINVGDGDATLVGIYDSSSGKYTKTILIDGGKSSAGLRILPYLKKVLGSSLPKVDYVALTHYHDDHYTGLLALGDGGLRADSVIDQGGYEMGLVFPAQASMVSVDQKPAAMAVFPGWTAMLKQAVAGGYVKGHVTGLFHFGAENGTDLGKKLLLGAVGGEPVTLECVAGWGNTMGAGNVVANPSPGKVSPNNFTLAFILQFGQFRYFIGGDLGGNGDSPYIDQEKPLSSFFAFRYPTSWSWNHNKEKAGHVCGFKGNHHGSSYSNGNGFMAAMSPAICIISAGKNASWKLPRPRVIEGFSLAVPLSEWTSLSGQNCTKGLYVTNLFDFTGFKSKSTAVDLFSGKPGVSFSYGNRDDGGISGYMVRVDGSEVAQKSQFQVYRVDDSGTRLLANYFCHTR